MDTTSGLKSQYRSYGYLLLGLTVGAALLWGVSPLGKSAHYQSPVSVSTGVADENGLNRLFGEVAGQTSGPGKPTVAKISIQRANSVGILPAIDWVCKVKHVPCEMLLAIAQLETSTGIQGTTLSSAGGLWQITEPQFIARVKKYGPDNLTLIADYINQLDTASVEYKQSRRAYAILVDGLSDMRNPRYGRDIPFTNLADKKILRARDNNFIVPALLVASCMLDDLRIVAEKTGLPLEETFEYAYLAHVYGGPFAGVVIDSYKKNPHQRMIDILTAYYEHRDEAGTRLTRTGRRRIENSARKILADNGSKPNVSVEDFLNGYIQKYTGLAGAIKARLDGATGAFVNMYELVDSLSGKGPRPRAAQRRTLAARLIH